MRISIAATVAAGLLLSSCVGDGTEISRAEPASESPTTEPTETASAEAPADEIDVTTTPDEVTPEWVTAVVNALLAEYGELEAEILSTPPAVEPELPNAYADILDRVALGPYREFLEIQTRALFVDFENEREPLLPSGAYTGLRFVTEVVQVSDPGCVVAVGRFDRSGTLPDGGLSETLSAVSLTLRAGRAQQLPPWVILDELTNTAPDGSPNADNVMLEATLSDYGDALESTCEAGDR